MQPEESKINPAPSASLSSNLLSVLFLVAALLTLADKVSGTPALSLLSLVIMWFCFARSWNQITRATRIIWLTGGIATAMFFFLGGQPEEFFLAASRAMFLPALLSVMTLLQIALQNSAPVNRVARFVVEQPPGRRFGMLALAGHVFGILLNIGGYRLLLALAVRQCHDMTADLRIRGIQERRILCATIAGFGATILWSPIGIAINLILPLIDDFDWIDYAPYGLATTLVFVGTAFLIDRTGPKPRLGKDKQERQPVWFEVGQLLSLLLGISIGSVLIDIAFGIPMQGALLLAIPVAAGIWHLAGRSPTDSRPIRELGTEAFAALGRPINEICLILSTGYLGLILVDIVPRSAIMFVVDTLGFPPVGFALLTIAVIPAFSMIGLSPMITGTMMVGTLVEADIGIPAPMLILATLSGWAISMIISPVTATVAISSSIMARPAIDVGWRSNGKLALTFGLLISSAFLIATLFS